MKKEQKKGSIDLSRLRRISLKERKNLVKVEDFAHPVEPSAPFARIIDSLPQILAGEEFRSLVEAIVISRRNERGVVAALGAHVVKCGLSPIIIDLMERGILTAVAVHGATAIHDFEIASLGRTSEDVVQGLKEGTYGMAEETARAFAGAAEEGSKGKGLGRALGELILQTKSPYAKYSILAAASRLDLPATVHVALGTDTIHMHPEISGAQMGEASLIDFHKIASVVCELERGVWLNIGSAVILPEVFLKAVAIARNLGHQLQGLTTANLDFIQHYRPRMNVIERPTKASGVPGRGIALTGHHEIMLPLLRLAILARVEKK